ncbi:MAG: radical SAM protein [Ignavibacterium sp.]|jgi:wyosine [tRNA(Phe)-imidazoG37] synthetase (radical SAM superfamily)
MNSPRHVYGPVPSRRLGRSLGVDVVPHKLCTLDCLFCELGPTDKRGLRRREYISPFVITAEIRKALEKDSIDVISFSGSGEPTLNSSLGIMIHSIKSFTDLPVAVLTNGTLLFLEDVRRDLMGADIVLPSLHAARTAAFEAVARPHPLLRLHTIIAGLKQFRKQFRGNLWLEIVLLRGINDSDDELLELRRAINEIRPDRIQLNTVVRPPASPHALPVPWERLTAIRSFFGEQCEIIAPRDQLPGGGDGLDADVLLATLRRRPLNISEIAVLCGKSETAVSKWLEQLVRAGSIRSFVYQDVKYYKLQDQT